MPSGWRTDAILAEMRRRVSAGGVALAFKFVRVSESLDGFLILRLVVLWSRRFVPFSRGGAFGGVCALEPRQTTSCSL